MATPNNYTIEGLLEPLPDTQYLDASTNAVAKGYRLAGRATWEAYSKAQEAMQDPLTGLLRKEYWKADIEKRKDAEKPFGIIFMDLDHFKLVNDELGHERGDILLSAFGNHLAYNFKRKSDFLAREQLVQEPDANSSNQDQPIGSRYGGDEFSATIDLYENSRRNNCSPQEAMELEVDFMREIVADFVQKQPPDIQSKNFNISIGYSVWDPQNPISTEQLLSDADTAMYVDKASNRANELAQA